MPIARKFIDWKTPLLPAVVADLLGGGHKPSVSDTPGARDALSNTVLVFPGREAGRRFLELLTIATDGRITPPKVITVGDLPEWLYEPKRPFASELTQELAWAEALRNIPEERLRQVVRIPPGEDDFEGWLALGQLLSRQHCELAAEQMDFADVARLGAELDGFDEQQRWSILREVQEAYLRILDGLELWDRQTARLVAIQNQECRTARDVLLIGTVDINRTLRSMLAQVADRVTAYVHAPAAKSGCFDEFGCVLPEQWERTHVELTSRQVRVVERPTDQARELAHAIAEFDGAFSAEEITIGAPDERVIPYIRRTLEACGLPTRWAVERTVSDTEPYRFLAAAADYVESGTVPEFAALVRHPDVSDWLCGQGLPPDWLSLLDEYLSTRFPRQLSEFLGDDKPSWITKRLKHALDPLLDPLAGKPRPVSKWAEPVAALLHTLYGDRRFDREEPADVAILEAASQIRAVLLNFSSVPERLSPKVSSVQAIRLCLSAAGGGTVPPKPVDRAVEITGWLELPLDDAPALIVTSFNEGFVPSAIRHDLFLPNGLRAHLGIEDNARRYARDCYSLEALLQSRKRVVLIVGKRDVQGEPLTPSRLLFAAEPRVVAQRVLEFYERRPEEKRPPLPGTLVAKLEKPAFAVPRPVKRESRPDYFRVTEFADYIASPYRYYLRHVLGLAAMDDQSQELDPAAFGSLLHQVLGEFGDSALRDSTDRLEIQQFLDNSLDACIARTFGRSPLFPVQIQVEQARIRLHDFADWQARWAGEGWRIRYAEVNPKEPVPFTLDSKRTVYLKGRIDRIDHHPGRNEWLILDYKTGERAADPEENHRDREGTWLDLQLPLYRHLARPLGVAGNVRMGYVLLPRERRQVDASIAEWTDAELQEADEVARRVAKDILAEKFWIEQDDSPDRLWEFSAICQEGVAEREAIV